MPNDYITQIKDTNGVTYDIRDPSKQDELVSGTNIKTINNTSLLGSGDITIQGGGNNIFWATYGTTTSAEIESAYQDGKVVCLEHYSFVCILCQRTSATEHLFSGEQGTSCHIVSCDANNWYSYDVAPTSTPVGYGIAQWDSSSKMNSTDMSIQDVNDFVSSLNVIGSGIIIGSDYIKIGSFGACWGTGTPSSINSQNAITFPITFSSEPYGFATFRGDAKGSTYNQITVKGVTTTGMTVYYYESGGAVKSYNWFAVGTV